MDVLADTNNVETREEDLKYIIYTLLPAKGSRIPNRGQSLCSLRVTMSSLLSISPVQRRETRRRG